MGAGDDREVYDRRDEIVRGRLDRYIDYSARTMALISFVSIFIFKFDVQGELGLEDVSVFSAPQIWAAATAPGFAQKLLDFLLGHGLAIALFLFTALWYSWYVSTVKNELGIMASLFARLNPPREYEALQGGDSVPLLALGLTGGFVLLALVTDMLAVYCVIVLALNLLDYRGNATIRDNLRKFLSDDALKPAPSDPESRFVLARRRVAEIYWLERWQLRRIIWMMLANAIALGLALTPPTALPQAAEFVRLPLAYGIVCAVILWNQWLLRGWRAERDDELRLIRREEARVLYPHA